MTKWGTPRGTARPAGAPAEEESDAQHAAWVLLKSAAARPPEELLRGALLGVHVKAGPGSPEAHGLCGNTSSPDTIGAPPPAMAPEGH